jgi:hypothetical protein
MQLSPEQAHELIPHVDPGRVRNGVAVGLRDGALLALVAAGLSAVEIADLRGTAITMTGGHLTVSLVRKRIIWSAALPTDLGARLLAWIAERRLWAVPEPVFRGTRGPLTAMGIHQVLNKYRDKRKARR